MKLKVAVPPTQDQAPNPPSSAYTSPHSTDQIIYVGKILHDAQKSIPITRAI